MKKKLLAGLAVGAFMLGMAGMAHANSMSFGFSKLTINSTEDLSGQLQGTVWDAGQANSTFDLSLTGTDVLFTFTNNVGIASDVTEIYFDDGSLLGLSSVYNSADLGGSGLTTFVGGAAQPVVLPDGNNAFPVFEVTAGFLADSDLLRPKDGINESGEIVGIAFTLQGTQTWEDVVDELLSGELRVGFHIRSIGVSGDSASYINTPPNAPVPEPATMLLMGTGLAGLVAARRRKAKKS